MKKKSHGIGDRQKAKKIINRIINNIDNMNRLEIVDALESVNEILSVAPGKMNSEIPKDKAQEKDKDQEEYWDDFECIIVCALIIIAFTMLSSLLF